MQNAKTDGGGTARERASGMYEREYGVSGRVDAARGSARRDMLCRGRRMSQRGEKASAVSQCEG